VSGVVAGRQSGSRAVHPDCSKEGKHMSGFIDRFRAPEAFDAGFDFGFTGLLPANARKLIGGAEIRADDEETPTAIRHSAYYEGQCAGWRARRAAEGRGPFRYCWHDCTPGLLQVVRVDVNHPSDPRAETAILTCGHPASPRFVPEPGFSAGHFD
jgi:hypothetical protein